jgi:glucose-6-phosphate isomerase
MRIAGIEAHLGEFEIEIAGRLETLERDRFGERLWGKDATLWKKDSDERKGIVDAMGWLDVPEKMKANAGDLARFAAELKSAGFRHVLHMGMGGSSLAPLVFQKTFGPSSSACGYVLH